MGISGMDDVEVSPLKGSARRSQRKLGILPLVGIFVVMNVARIWVLLPTASCKANQR